jgi:hypothetical protein
VHVRVWAKDEDCDEKRSATRSCNGSAFSIYSWPQSPRRERSGPPRPCPPSTESRFRVALTFLTSSSLRPTGLLTAGTGRVLALPAIARRARISGMRNARFFGTDTLSRRDLQVISALVAIRQTQADSLESLRQKALSDSSSARTPAERKTL